MSNVKVRELTQEEFDEVMGFLIGNGKAEDIKPVIEKQEEPVVDMPIPAVTFEKMRVYTKNGDVVLIDPRVYNGIANVSQMVIGDILSRKDNLDRFDSRALFSNRTATVDSAIEIFCSTIINIFSCIGINVDTGDYIKKFEGLDTVSLFYSDRIKEEYQHMVDTIGGYIDEYARCNTEGRSMILEKNKIAYYVSGIVNKFASVVYTSFRDAINSQFYTLPASKANEIITKAYESLDQQFFNAMGNIAYEMSVFEQNIVNIDPIIVDCFPSKGSYVF